MYVGLYLFLDFAYDEAKFEVTDEMKKCFDDQGYLLLRFVLSKDL